MALRLAFGQGKFKSFILASLRDDLVRKEDVHVRGVGGHALRQVWSRWFPVSEHAGPPNALRDSPLGASEGRKWCSVKPLFHESAIPWGHEGKL